MSDNDCPDGKECELPINQCVPMTCRESLSKIGGSINSKQRHASSNWFIGDTAEFCCEEGIHVRSNMFFR